ncbi:MAG: TIM barrel protein [Candidatus Heimdallarchaeota archaeon]
MMDKIQVGCSYSFSRFVPNRTQFETAVKEFINCGLNTIELLFLGCVLGIPKPGPLLYYPSVDQATSTSKLLSGFSISIHGPYTISLTATEKRQKQTTKAHFTMNLKLGHALGATHLTFHTGTRKHQGDGKLVKAFLKEILAEKEKKGYNLRLAPEVAGKLRSFAGFRQIVEVAHECGTLFCWDFSHDFARGGDVTTEAGILKRLELIDDNIDLKGNRLPIHLSGIVGGRWGEVTHTFLDRGSGVPWRLFLTVLREQGWLERIQIICESKGKGTSGLDARVKDALNIKKFIETGESVTEYVPRKSRLDAHF